MYTKLMNKCNQEKFRIMYRELLEKYSDGGSMISKTQLADYIGVTTRTLTKQIGKGDCPSYKRLGSGKTAPYLFAMLNVCEWVLGEEID